MPNNLFSLFFKLLRGKDASPDTGEAVGEGDGTGESEDARAHLVKELLRFGLDPDPGEDELGKRQELFAFLEAKLRRRAYEMGFKVRLGEALRTEEQQEIYRRQSGRTYVSRSLHQDKLAIDYNLFKGGKYLDQTEDHRTLGEWWEQLHPLCRWGGRFGDGNHYSITYGGRK